MIQHQIMRCMVDHSQEFLALTDGYLALTTGHDSCPKSRNFNVLLPLMAMENQNRIILDKGWVVILGYLCAWEVLDSNLARELVFI